MRTLSALVAISAVLVSSSVQAKAGKPHARIAAPPAAIVRDCANRTDPKPGSFSPLAVYSPRNVQVSPVVFVCLAAPAGTDDGDPETTDARYRQYVTATVFSASGHPLSQAVVDNRCQTKDQRKLTVCKDTRTLASFTAAEICKRGRPFECVDPSYGKPAIARVRWQFMTSTISRQDEGIAEVEVIPY